VISKSKIRTFTGSNQGAWEQPRASLVTPAGTTTAQLRMVVKGLDGTVYVDDFSVPRALVGPVGRSPVV
jgi:hypothetical protein